MEQIILQNIRVQLLNQDILRIEYASGGAFCDKDTFFIPNREALKGEVSYSREENEIFFGAYTLSIPKNARSLAGVCLKKGGERVYRYKKLENSGELPPLDKTPEVFALSDTPHIFIPQGGYSRNREGQYRIEENVQDIYLLLCQKDARKLRRLYVQLTGRPELVRLSTLGGWNSKYYAYCEETAKRLILDYEKYDVPLDNMVIDTDWRSCANGWGYDINTELFPDMKRFLDFAHEHGVEVMFNDHPEPKNGNHVFCDEEIAYREENLQNLMALGLDTWWYDRNWSTSLVSCSKNVRWETFGLYLFSDITKHFYQNEASTEIYRRPVIMGNAVNIQNGTYLQISDSASHRYSIQWTGDVGSTLHDLGQEVESLLKAGNNVVSYINADCGGHTGDPTKEEFIRWMQFGTLSPVFRPHCTNYVERFREPWLYDEETLDIVRQYNDLRYRLLPVIYCSAHMAYETGEPICKALGWAYPRDKRALRCTDQYMLGDDILIKPICKSYQRPLEKKHFTQPVTAMYYNGCQLQGDPIGKLEYDRLHLSWNGTSPLENGPIYDFSARYNAQVCFDRAVELWVRCDDGATVYIDEEKVLEDKTFHSAKTFFLKELEANKVYHVQIEYFQGGAEAEIGLYYTELADRQGRVPVYLPEGKWLDVFDGKLYRGGRLLCKRYGLREMPLFVRSGALIPLAHNAHNTKQQQWNDLVLDFYPDKQASDRGYLYEDDTQTTAYQLGQFRTSAYEAYYDAQENAFVIRLHAAEGTFAGERCYAKRHVSIKFHRRKELEDVTKVTCNGKMQSFVRTTPSADAFPLNAQPVAADAEVVFVPMEIETAKEYEIKFYL